MLKKVLVAFLVAVVVEGACVVLAQDVGEITGELKRWHPITVTFDGPDAGETAEPNPFRYYRLNVTFRHEDGRDAYVAPGYFAADGNAAETSATSGNKWRVHFTPSKLGLWTYTASFRQGDDVAVSLSPTAGESTPFDGTRGTFVVEETDKTGRDFRGKGMLRYAGERYLRFDSGEWFMKGGTDAPETLLGYKDFDGTYTHSGEFDHSYGDILVWIAAGGDGVEWYFGYGEEQNDLNAEDWRSRDALWNYTRYAMEFYRDNEIPFWEMNSANNLTRSEKDFVFADPGEVYVIYLPDGGASTLNLQSHQGTYTVDWYNPRSGGSLQKGQVLVTEETYSREPATVLSAVPNIRQPRVQNGSVVEVTGPGMVSLGMPPEDVREDWVILVRSR